MKGSAAIALTLALLAPFAGGASAQSTDETDVGTEAETGTGTETGTETEIGIETETNGSGDAAVRLLSLNLPAVMIHTSAWVPISWINSGPLEAREFHITDLGSQDVDLAFPDYRNPNPEQPFFPTSGQYSSLYNDATLASNELDFTAVKVTPTGPNPKLVLQLNYVSDTRKHSEEIELVVPTEVSEFDRDGIAIDDAEIGPLSTDAVDWVNLDVSGLANTSAVEVRVLSDSVDVVYPGDSDFSGLDTNSNLSEGETDHAGVRLDVRGLDAGNYPINVEVTYWVGGAAKTITQQRMVIVEGVDRGPLYDSRVDPGPWRLNPEGTDTATTGQWDLGGADGIQWGQIATQLGDTPSGADALFTTGAAGSSVGANDVDSGITSIQSGDIALPAGQEIELSLSYYLAYLNNANSDDYMRVTVIGEIDRLVVVEERATQSTRKSAAWQPVTADLTAFAGQSIQILVEAADIGAGSLIEAAVADLIID